jgi:hypothetical protein
MGVSQLSSKPGVRETERIISAGIQELRVRVKNHPSGQLSLD